VLVLTALPADTSIAGLESIWAARVLLAPSLNEFWVPGSRMVEARRRTESTPTPLTGVRLLVVQSDYYEEIAAALLAGAKRALEPVQVAYDVVTVPGALEIPQAAAMAVGARGRRIYGGIVALGCVIRGETSHYDIVAGESARALMEIGIHHRIPIGNGILTVDNADQAAVRAALDRGDKGGAAAKAVIALLRVRMRLAAARKRR
jgi:6,7-dimethyl-8-ribityllumazine synthase